MNSLRLNAYAKLNIGLRITGKREDGYHNIRTLYQTVSLSDTIKIRLKEESGIDLEFSGESVPGGEENICYKTAKIGLPLLKMQRLFIRKGEDTLL